MPVSRGGAEQEDARPDNVLGVYFPYHVPLVAFKAALTSVSCLSSSHLAFRNVCCLSPTAGNCVAWFMRSFNVQSPLVNFTLNPGERNLEKVHLCLLPLILLAIVSNTIYITQRSPSSSCRISCYVPKCCPNNLVLVRNSKEGNTYLLGAY